MPAKKKSDKSPQDRLAEAALKLAADGQWRDATLADIGRSADLKLSDLFEVARSKTQVLDLVDKVLTEKTVADVGELDASMSVREKLFDLLMTRFECMNEEREGFLELSRHARSHLSVHPSLNSNLSFLANLAGIEADGVVGSGRMLAICQIYGRVLAVWRDDQTDDLSVTMKELDTRLAKAEEWATNLNDFGGSDFGATFNNLNDLAKSFSDFGMKFAKDFGSSAKAGSGDESKTNTN